MAKPRIVAEVEAALERAEHAVETVLLRILREVKHDGVVLGIGSEVPVEKTAAQALVDSGAAALIQPASAAVTAVTTAATDAVTAG